MQVVLNNYSLIMLVNVNLWSCTRKTLKKNPTPVIRHVVYIGNEHLLNFWIRVKDER